MDITEHVETVLRRLTAGGKKLRPGGLILRLSKFSGIPQLDVQLALEELVRAGSLSGVSKSGQPLTLVGWTGTALPLSQAEMLLSEVIANFNDESSKATLQPLLKIAELFSGLSADDINYVIHGMLQCKKGSINHDPIFASAANILGSAKALNNLRGAARNLSLQWSNNACGELYVLTAGPARPDAVVLIENIKSFTAFARSRHAKHAVAIAAFGYGLTMENFGNRLVAQQIVACCAYGDTVNLYDAISHCPIFFWGDLDREGIRIWGCTPESQKFPSAQLQSRHERIQVDELAVSLECVMPVQQDVPPGRWRHLRDQRQRLGIASCLVLRQQQGQDRRVVEDDRVADQPGALVADLDFDVGAAGQFLLPTDLGDGRA